MGFRNTALISLAAASVIVVGTVATVSAQEAPPEYPPSVEVNPDGTKRHSHIGRLVSVRTAVSATIGIRLEDIRAALHEGQSLADVAFANGSSVEAVISAILTALEERLAAAVAVGRLSAEDAAAKLDGAQVRITEGMNALMPFSERPARPFSERRPRMGDSTL